MAGLPCTAWDSSYTRCAAAITARYNIKPKRVLAAIRAGLPARRGRAGSALAAVDAGRISRPAESRLEPFLP
jgi:hypothetical protein